MKFLLKAGEIQFESTPLLMLGMVEDTTELSPSAAKIDNTLGGQISQIIADGDFKGKLKELALLYPAQNSTARRVLLVGLGKMEKISLESIRCAAGIASKRARELGVSSFTSEIFGLEINGIAAADAAQAWVEGAALSLYEFRALKSEKGNHKIEEITLVVPAPRLAEAQPGVDAGKAIVEGVCLTRDLVNLPSNIATPAFLASQAQAMAEKFNLTCQVLDEAQMKELGMGALLAVAQGSDQPAHLIILEHNANKTELDTLVLAGKGITFDSGGISIKPSEGMEKMTADMAGAAAVIGAMQVIAALNLPLHMVGLAPAVENMPGGKAYKPGDVVRAMNGKTVEIISTDAEGRMLLIDALCYAARYKPQAVVDIATLTGARVIALGDFAAGLYSNSDNLIHRLTAAGQKTYERVWAMPMFEEYEESLKSVVADYKHTGGRPGGSITAAKFIEKFTAFPWAHLDIAGLVTADTDKPYAPKGANGYGVRLLVQFLRDWAAAGGGH